MQKYSQVGLKPHAAQWVAKNCGIYVRRCSNANFLDMELQVFGKISAGIHNSGLPYLLLLSCFAVLVILELAPHSILNCPPR
jgi:hypothetical protein